MPKIAVKIIDLNLATGLISMAGKTHAANSWEDAAEVLRQWTAEADDSRVMKCDFRATFDDGFVYSGTMDFGRGKDNDIAAHVDRMVKYVLSDNYAGLAFRAGDPREDVRKTMAWLADHYDLGSEMQARDFGL